MKKYYNYSVKKAVTVKNLITVESLDASRDFSYPTEEHNFYELLYVDSGRLRCTLNDKQPVIAQGQMLLITPSEPHSYLAMEDELSSFFIVCFTSSSPSLEILSKVITLEKSEKLLLSEIIREARDAFAFPFKKKIVALPTHSFGAAQLVIGKLEELLIKLIRIEFRESTFIKPVMSSVELENNLVGDIITLLKDRLYSTLTLDEICERTFYSKTYLNNIFKRSTGFTIMRYYHMLKIEEAKKLLKKKSSTTEIAAKLCFESATYFIKFFKRYEKMTPTEYKNKIL